MSLLSIFLFLFGPLIDFIAMRCRPLAMVVFVLPVSFVVSRFVSARNRFAQWVFGSGTHEERVLRVQKDVLARLDLPPGERKFMCTARAPWQNLSTRFADYKKDSNCIYVGDFNHILSLDEEALTVDLEPMVDVDQATRYLVPRGYMLATTLEIKEATLGGLACAVGMTTASHKYGLLQETVVEYQVVTGDGRVLSVTRDNEHSELFHTIPWSHGSIALLLKLKMRIIPIKKYVRVDYHAITTGMKDYCACIVEESIAEDPADFVEATCFSRNEAVVFTGTFVDHPDASKGRVNHLGRWHKKWYYTHVRDMLGNPRGGGGGGGGERGGDDAGSSMVKRRDGGGGGGGGRTPSFVEYVPTYQYIFRHDRGIFWTLDDQLPESVGNHPLFRWTLGWLCPPKVQFLKLPATKAIREEMMVRRVYQDIVLPIDVLEESLTLAADSFEIWPLLVYPSRIYDRKDPAKQGLFRAPKTCLPGKDYAMYFDLGCYGIPPAIARGEPFPTVTRMRRMEHFTREHRGCPFLYADTFMDKEEFEQMLDLSLYHRVRERYEAHKHFPHVYQKTSGCQSFDWKAIISKEKETEESGGKKKTE